MTKVELCGTCNSGGILITCESCDISYHKECVDPPLTRAKQNWVCNKCKDNSTDYQEEPKKQNNNDRGSRRTRRSDRDLKKYVENEGRIFRLSKRRNFFLTMNKKGGKKFLKNIGRFDDGVTELIYNIYIYHIIH